MDSFHDPFDDFSWDVIHVRCLVHLMDDSISSNGGCSMSLFKSTIILGILGIELYTSAVEPF